MNDCEERKYNTVKIIKLSKKKRSKFYANKKSKMELIKNKKKIN